VLIRWAAVTGQAFTAAVVHWGLGFTLPVLAVGGVIAMSALLNLAVSLGRPASARIDDREAAIFLVFDILQLTVLLHLTGGNINPFALLLLAPVAIGATMAVMWAYAALAADLVSPQVSRPLRWFLLLLMLFTPPFFLLLIMAIPTPAPGVVPLSLGVLFVIGWRMRMWVARRLSPSQPAPDPVESRPGSKTSPDPAPR